MKMPLPNITERMIQEYTTDQSFERGEDYYANGAVLDPIRRGMKLEARVQGSSYTPYHVSITLDENGIQSAGCTCPYDWGGFCKHIVAVLLTFCREPGAFAERPAPSEWLETLPAERLRALLADLLDRRPDLLDWVEVQVGLVQPDEEERQMPVDTAAFRRQVRNAIDLLDYRNHWESIWEMVSALDDVHAQARSFLESGDFKNALALMRVIGEEVIPDYGDLEEECQLSDFLCYTWSEDLTEAILGADLSADEVENLLSQLEDWAKEAGDYGLDELFDKPIAACAQGWDTPPEDASEWYTDITEQRLNILRQRGDDEVYLKMALDAGLHVHYVYHLIEMGRISDAVTHALEHPIPAPERLRLAKRLHEEGEPESAYLVAKMGLSSEGRRYDLAEWLAGAAEQRGDIDDAVGAWRVAFEDAPSLEAYQNVKRLSGGEWEGVRSELLPMLEERPSVWIEALIEDGEIDEAIRVWDERYQYGGYTLLEKLVDASAAARPDWAAEHAISEARHLINKASKYYPRAVDWLEKAKAIYLQHERPEDWQKQIADIRTQHGRKYSLMRRLKNRRL